MGPPESIPETLPLTRPRPWRPILIVAAGALAYANSFSGTFFFDDFHNIVDQPAIRHLRPLSRHLSVDRPILRLSCALNYAISGLETWSYHAVNLAVHILAALCLFGVVRRTLRIEQVRSRFTGSAENVALAVALLWMLHPIQTESVTYIIQRSESIMGLCFLLALYCLIRADGSRRAWAWFALLVIACAVGAGAKPVMAMAPLVLILFDATFLSGSYTSAVRRRAAPYVAVAACGLILAVGGMARVVMANRAAQLVQSGLDFFTTDHWRYLRTQFEVILHYLRLCLWPWDQPFCLDYNWPEAASFRQVAVPAALMLGLFAATIVGLARRTWWGFVGAWFFVILAPSSSLLPIEHRAFEHRMYLSLAAVTVLAVFASRSILVRIGGRLNWTPRFRAGLAALLVVAVSVGLAAATLRRNQDYQSSVAMWADVVAKRPLHMTARANLARGLLREDRVAEAIEVCRAALALSPEDGYVLFQYGTALQKSGRLSEAVACYQRAIRQRPTLAFAHANLSDALMRLNRIDEAEQHARLAVELEPASAALQNAYGLALAGGGRVAEACAAYAAALELEPDFLPARNNLGIACKSLGRLDEAVDHYRAVLSKNPAYLDARYNLALALRSRGDLTEAEGLLRGLLDSPAHAADARLELANLLGSADRADEALNQFREAARLFPDRPGVHAELATACYHSHHPDEAIVHYQAALRLTPNDARLQRQLGLVYYELGRLSEARGAFGLAVRLAPNEATAHHLLACALLALEQYAPAAEECRAALRIDPTLADTAYNLGLALEGLGQAREAREQFEAALRLDPKHEAARSKLAAR